MTVKNSGLPELEDYPMMNPEETVPCPECDGKGYVKCQHEEEDHGICLDCGYDLNPEKIDTAKLRMKERG